MNRQTYKGRYQLKFPHKYRGDIRNVIYRSSWELRFMIYADTHPGVVEWSSEETIIPYLSPKDNQLHRYFVDFWIKVKQKDGNIGQFLIEVKPKSQVNPPKVKKRKTARYLQECLTYEINQAKWEAARQFCAKKGMKFQILTEDHLVPK